MHYRRLGKTNLIVSEIGYGAWGIGGAFWIGANDRESLRALRLAMDGGVNFIDTALVYGDGHSEKLVGQAVRESGRRVYIATKVPPKNRIWPAQNGIGIEEAFPGDYIVRSAEESLRNLGCDTIDVLQLHVWNNEWLDRDEWRRGFEDLRKSGKVRATGVSVNAHDPDSALGVVATGLIDTVQVIYNIFDPTAAKSLFPACASQDVGVIVRVPFDEGSLAGRIERDTTFPEGDFRNRYFRDDRKKQVEDRVRAIMKDLRLEELKQLPEIALRFCLSDPAVSTVIPGMRSTASVEANLLASGQGPLLPSALALLRNHAWQRNFYDW
jgi:aryl-alcohol dehydrogenase-like predicted oxidoreductase